MVSDYGLPPQIRFLHLYWRNNAGELCRLMSNDGSITILRQLLIIVIQRNTAEFGLTIAAIPVALLLLIVCALAVRREIKWFV